MSFPASHPVYACPGANSRSQGQFFPFFVLTLTSLVTLPLTWTILSPSKSQDDGAQRGKASSAFEAEHGVTEVKSQRSAQRRKMRRVKRTVVVLLGWAVIGFMVYLILTTQRITPKVWNPYDILEIAEVGDMCSLPGAKA